LPAKIHFPSYNNVVYLFNWLSLENQAKKLKMFYRNTKTMSLISISKSTGFQNI